MKVTRKQLWIFLSNQEDAYADLVACCDGETNGITEEVFNHLKELLDDDLRQPIRPIIADQNMSEDHPGGDDLVAAVDDVLAAIKDGYRIVTWYGPETEVLIAGYWPTLLTVEG